MSQHGKFGVHVTSLHYGSREAYISGLDDILAQPALSLAQEFNRSFRWEPAACRSESVFARTVRPSRAAADACGTQLGRL